LANQALAAGDCDLVGMTRAQIADPDVARKCAAGEVHRIRPCTGSNQGCIDRQAGPYPITCFHNPEVGQERTATIHVIPRREPLLVVGGGPAGLKAAEIAARRGFAVTLVERGDRLGGRLNLVEHLGAASNLLASVAWLEQELPRHGVEIRLHTNVDADLIAAFGAKHAVLAAGATPQARLDAGTDGSVPVLSIDDAARGEHEGMKIAMNGTRALLVDLRGNIETGLVAECLARRGARVTIVTPFLNYGPGIGFTHMVDLMPVLLEHRCTFRNASKVTGIRDGAVAVRNAFTGETLSEPFDLVVAGVHPQPNTALYDVLAARCRVIMAGDVVAPRCAMEAYREGDRAARLL
jgi:NADPH-dependent 2,4-dienoyl-CoA reductase/sulfur reductase-like enzyme